MQAAASGVTLLPKPRSPHTTPAPRPPRRPGGRGPPPFTPPSPSAPSPIVELNRAVAFGKAFGPAAGLAIADALVADGALAQHYLLSAVRGDLLEKLGRTAEARAEFERAADLTRNERERDVLLARAGRIQSG